jgi:hypothetical protein
MRLVGPTGAIAPGSSFDVQVRFDCPVATRGAQFGLSFDPRLVEAAGVDEGDYYRGWGTQNGASTVLVPGVQIDAQRGWVRTLAIALLGGPGELGPVGSGVLATAHFQAKAGTSGNATIALENVVVSQLQANGTLASAPSVQVIGVAIAIGTGSGPAAQPTPYLMGPNTLGPWGTGSAP